MNGTSSVDAEFWRDKRVVLTGHTGFKGSWLTLWLHRLGSAVTGISLPPSATPNLCSLIGIETICRSHFLDIREAAKLAELIGSAQPEIVIYMAAQPLVRESYRAPRETFATNVMGTSNVLDALHGLDSVRVAVMITTDKVYRENGAKSPYLEQDALGGHDPYSASKAASELVIASYRAAFLAGQGIAVASARAGNVIGGGDWAQDRLIPDAIRAWQSKKQLKIRRPQDIRPWQHVLDPLAGYLTLARRLWEQPALAGAYNFGPESDELARVRDLVELARSAYGEGEVSYCAETMGPREAEWLALETGKARTVLGIKPKWALQSAVTRTMAWYRAHERGANARALCDADIAAYEAAA